MEGESGCDPAWKVLFQPVDFPTARSEPKTARIARSALQHGRVGCPEYPMAKTAVVQVSEMSAESLGDVHGSCGETRSDCRRGLSLIRSFPS